MKEPFLSAIPILEKLQGNGHDAFFVGGSVRDFILGRDIHDIDIATSATPSEVMSIFPKHVPVGIEHGTVLVITSDGQYEITTFRVDGKYEDFRRPSEVEFVREIDEDLSRRDFTMNAIAMDIYGGLYDPFEGRKAIRKKQIITVGDPAKRFNEDALRMMRAIRFMSQLGFSLDSSIEATIKKECTLLENIAVERKRIEFEKLLMGDFREQALQKMNELQLYNVLPGFKDSGTNFIKICHPQLSALKHMREFWCFFIITLRMEDAISFLQEWKNPNIVIREVEKLLQAIDYLFVSSWTKRLVFDLGEELTESAAIIYAILRGQDITAEIKLSKTTFDALPMKKKEELAVNGRDILEWINKQPGPWLGDLLYTIESMVIEEKIPNNKGHIKEWVVTCNQK